MNFSTNESLVRMVVENTASYLPAGRVSPEKSKAGVEPGVNLVESQLPLRGVSDGLSDQRGIGKWRPNIMGAVKFTISMKFLCNV